MRTRIVAVMSCLLAACAPVRVTELPDFASSMATAPVDPIVPPILVDEAQAAGFTRFVEVESRRPGSNNWRYCATRMWDDLLAYRPDAVLYLDPARSDLIGSTTTEYIVRAIALRRVGDGPMPPSAVDLSRFRVVTRANGKGWTAIERPE